MRTLINKSGAEVGTLDPVRAAAQAAYNAEQNGYLVCGVDSIDVYRAAFGAVCPDLDAVVDRRPIGTGARQSYVFWIRNQDGSPLGCVELSGVWIVIHVGRGVRLMRDVSPDHAIMRPYVGHDSVSRIGSDSQHHEFRCAWKLSWQGGYDAAFVGQLGQGCLLDDMGCFIPDGLRRLDGKAITVALEKAHSMPRIHANPWIALDNVTTQWW